MLTRLTRPSYTRSLDFIVGRDELPRVLNERGLTGVGVEVGVNDGGFSERLLAGWRGRKLFSVDPWASDVDPNGDHFGWGQAKLDRLHDSTLRRLAPFGERSEVRRLTSVQAAAEFQPGSLDFVYLDAGHDLKSVRADIAAWYPRIRPGGILAGHDYFDGPRHDIVYGVAGAVAELCEREGLTAGISLRDEPTRSWFVQVPARGPS